jgi:hypothetical protein
MVVLRIGYENALTCADIIALRCFGTYLARMLAPWPSRHQVAGPCLVPRTGACKARRALGGSGRISAEFHPGGQRGRFSDVRKSQRLSQLDHPFPDSYGSCRS